MIVRHLNLRLTHKFRDGWADCDEHEYLGAIKLTPGRVVKERGGYDEGQVYTQRVRLPRKANKQKVMQALRDTLGGNSCRHEHDCCGCSLYYVDVRSIGKRDLLVHTTVGFNY